MVFLWLILFTFMVAAVTGSVMLILNGGWLAILAGILIFMGFVVETIMLLIYIFGTAISKAEEKKKQKEAMDFFQTLRYMDQTKKEDKA